MYSAIDHIASALWFGSYRRENLLVAFTAYFDDSGSDTKNPAQIVAGFVATCEQWNRFNDEWNRTLTEFGMSYFRAKEFDDGRRGHGHYKDWPEAKRRDFMSKLLGAIVRRTDRSFSTALEKRAYSAVIEPDPILKLYFGTPYAFAAFNCTHQTTDWRDETHPNTPVLFIFDEGHANEGELKRSREWIKNSDRMILDLMTEDDKRWPPLQAADLLAFEMCSDVRRQVTKANRYSRHPILQLDEHPHEWLEIGENTLRTVIPQLRARGVLPPD